MSAVLSSPFNGVFTSTELSNFRRLQRAVQEGSLTNQDTREVVVLIKKLIGGIRKDGFTPGEVEEVRTIQRDFSVLRNKYNDKVKETSKLIQSILRDFDSFMEGCSKEERVRIMKLTPDGFQGFKMGVALASEKYDKAIRNLLEERAQLIAWKASAKNEKLVAGKKLRKPIGKEVLRQAIKAVPLLSGKRSLSAIGKKVRRDPDTVKAQAEYYGLNIHSD